MGSSCGWVGPGSGARTPLRSITPGHADEFKEKILKDYPVATVSRVIIRVRQCFRAAKRWGLIDANPFEDVKGGSQANESRSFFVTWEMVQAVLDACTDDEWRLIFARGSATARVARRHYLQVTDADFEKATSHPTSPMHADGRTGPHVEKETAVTPMFVDYTAVHIPPAGIEPATYGLGNRRSIH